ncbi:hypothetical protein EI94DRAFT_1705838 [Lactarius quietus]|nr:hypothetical protein EI94DRAFT_1705838 [Lactarius quietus]
MSSISKFKFQPPPPITVWCLLIDHNFKPSFGEPFPVTIGYNGTTHEVKIRISGRPESPESRPDLGIVTNKIEIWKCKTLKLSAKDSFGRIKMLLHNFQFSYDENSSAEHLGVAQSIEELELESYELLLARVPQHSGYLAVF